MTEMLGEILVTISYKASIAELVEPQTGVWLKPDTHAKPDNTGSGTGAWLQPGTEELT